MHSEVYIWKTSADPDMCMAAASNGILQRRSARQLRRGEMHIEKNMSQLHTPKRHVGPHCRRPAVLETSADSFLVSEEAVHRELSILGPRSLSEWPHDLPKGLEGGGPLPSSPLDALATTRPAYELPRHVPGRRE